MAKLVADSAFLPPTPIPWPSHSFLNQSIGYQRKDWFSAFATSRLTRFNINPSPEHYAEADRTRQDLVAMKGLGLQFGQGNTFEVASDASFADNSLNRKSSVTLDESTFEIQQCLAPSRGHGKEN